MQLIGHIRKSFIIGPISSTLTKVRQKLKFIPIIITNSTLLYSSRKYVYLDQSKFINEFLPNFHKKNIYALQCIVYIIGLLQHSPSMALNSLLLNRSFKPLFQTALSNTIQILPKNP